MEQQAPQFFTIDCPHCGGKMNASHVAKQIPAEVFAVEVASRNGRRQTRHAGPGRPASPRCPGCDQKMAIAELRDHRALCLSSRIKMLTYRHIRLLPKDPDPYPDFFLHGVDDEKIKFEKLSSGHLLTIELQKIAEIAINDVEQRTYIRLLGRVHWAEVSQSWQFVPRLRNPQNPPKSS